MPKDQPTKELIKIIDALSESITKLKNAEIAIKKLRIIDPGYLPLNQLEAFLKLKSALHINSVLADYIDRLDRFPGDKFLRKAINKLHKAKVETHTGGGT